MDMAFSEGTSEKSSADKKMKKHTASDKSSVENEEPMATFEESTVDKKKKTTRDYKTWNAEHGKEVLKADEFFSNSPSLISKFSQPSNANDDGTTRLYRHLCSEEKYKEIIAEYSEKQITNFVKREGKKKKREMEQNETGSQQVIDEAFSKLIQATNTINVAKEQLEENVKKQILNLEKQLETALKGNKKLQEENERLQEGNKRLQEENERLQAERQHQDKGEGGEGAQDKN